MTLCTNKWQVDRGGDGEGARDHRHSIDRQTDSRMWSLCTIVQLKRGGGSRTQIWTHLLQALLNYERLINFATLSLLFNCRNRKSTSVALPDKRYQKGAPKAARRRGIPDDTKRESLRSSERAPRCKCTISTRALWISAGRAEVG